MSVIRQLPDSLINKIAAGEVIERPASVVKELLENSVDAGATRIEVTLEGGGTEMIRIADNGSGIAGDQLLLAVSPHATSKLPNDDDLFSVKTLGFRGEALASIAEISHITIRSRTSASNEGSELIVRGGDREGPVPCGCPTGTIMEVRNLFYNTPVRRKFLKTAQTEMGHTLEAFTRIALANPHVHMTLNSGSRVVQDLPVTASWSERIHNFFGGEVSDSLIAVSCEHDGVKLHGYVVGPGVSRSNNRMQYLFLNGRYIRDRALQHALGEAYRGLLMVGRFPICFLNIDIPSDQVDVNVHPTKSEVRFLDGGAIYRSMLQTIRNKFLSTDLTAKIDSPTRANSSFAEPESPAQLQPVSSIASTTQALPFTQPRFQDHEDRLVQWARGGNDEAFAARPQITQTTNHLPGSIPEFRPFPGNANPISTGHQQFAAPAVSQLEPNDFSEPVAHAPAPVRVDPSHPGTGSYLGFQIHNRYLITQDEQGMVVIDQHALHERIMYEQIREKVLSQTLETQRLLIPEPVTLTAAEAALALEHQGTLEQLGISIEPFGGDCILISSYPAMLANINPGDILRQIVEKLQSDGATPQSRDLIDSLLHMIACKAAIKAGDRLTPDEITSLLEQRYAYQDTHHCPHGRPTALHFSRQELDKMFKRT